MKVQSRVRRPMIGVVLAVVMASTVLTACQVAKVGAKCRTTDFGRDSTYVLQCKGGKWVRLMTIRDYLLLVKKIQDSQTTTTVPGTPNVPPVGPSPTASSWNLVGDVGLANPDSADGVDDGIGYAAVKLGNTAFVGGSFSQITDGTNTIGRGNLAAFDVTNGQPTSFVAHTNGKVTSLATDGVKLFVGGTFTVINGQARDHFAAIDPGTGNVYGGGWVKNFAGNTGVVYGLSVSASRVYVAGDFTNVSGVSRSKAAALSLTDGSIDLGFSPGAITGGAPNSIAASTDDSRVYIGGPFTTIAGVSDAGTTELAELNSAGVVQHPTIGFGGVDSPALDLEVTTGNDVLSALGGEDNETSRHAPGGGRLWTTGDFCRGDAQAVHQIGNAVYAGYHQSCKDSAGNYDPTYHLVKINDAGTGAVDFGFKPVFDGYWGVFGLAGDTSALIAVGQFDHVNGQNHKGFAIFRPAPQ